MRSQPYPLPPRPGECRVRCRFAVSLIHSKPGRKAAETLRRLNRNARTAFDDLLMSENSRRRPAARAAAAGATAPA